MMVKMIAIGINWCQ